MGFLLDRKVSNYMAPKGYMLDSEKMNEDLTKNHLSKEQVKRNMLAHKYIKPIPDFLKPYHKNA